MMVAYDSQIISQFADRVYKKANLILIRYAVLGFMVGLLLFFLLASALERSHKPVYGGSFLALLLLLFLWGFCTLVGLEIGRNKVFALKLEAQTALVMVQIEENTRPTVGSPNKSAAPGPPA